MKRLRLLLCIFICPLLFSCSSESFNVAEDRGNNSTEEVADSSTSNCTMGKETHCESSEPETGAAVDQTEQPASPNQSENVTPEPENSSTESEPVSESEPVETPEPIGISGGALNGDRIRVLVSAELPDAKDDIQSFIHLLLVSDVIDLEGVVSSHAIDSTSQYDCGDGSTLSCIHSLIDSYEIDYHQLNVWSEHYPHPDRIRERVKSGAPSSWSDSGQNETDGSRLIVEQALNADSRPLYILEWGALTNTATALYHHPEIADRIRIIMSSGNNADADPDAYNYLRDSFPDVFFVEAQGAATGLRYPEDGDGFNNDDICQTVRTSGRLGRRWCDANGSYKEFDFITAYYLLAGDPENPAAEHWGGRFENSSGNRWADVSDPEMQMTLPEQGTVNGALSSSQWRMDRLNHLLDRFNRIAMPKTVRQYDLFEVALADNSVNSPYSADFSFDVEWTLPDGSVVNTNGFYDGEGLFRARAYTAITGLWRWKTSSSASALNNVNGQFTVTPSSLPGKLRKHNNDPFQFQHNNGDWFVHVGDTAYRFVNQNEAEWKPYLSQANTVGFNKLRTWFNGGRHDVQILFNSSRDGLNIPYWQEMERRLHYAAIYYPHIQFQLIPYGEDTSEIRRYESDRMTRMIAKEAQARFSSFPNVQWCIVNDREVVTGGSLNKERQVYASSIDTIGNDMAQREPWGTLITNHQARWEGYSFVDSSWSDIITLEDLDQVGGDLVSQYRSRSDNDPVILEEDRYELYRGPSDPAFFFRRLFWSNILAGGHATYGGLATYEASDSTDDTRGITGYFDSASTSLRLTGADQLQYIHSFFADSGLTMVDFNHDQNIVNDSGNNIIAATGPAHSILYVANPSSSSPEYASADTDTFQFELQLDKAMPANQVNWFNPVTGQWSAHSSALASGSNSLETPAGADWILVLGIINLQ